MTDKPTTAPGTTAGGGPAPMTDEHLARIRRRAARQHASGRYLPPSDFHVLDLLAEVDRLRAHVTEMETPPADGESPMPDDPAEARVLWTFITAHARWQANQNRKHRAELATRDGDLSFVQATVDGWQNGLIPPSDALIAIRDTLTGHTPGNEPS